MNIAIVAPSPVPFLIGGAERVWDGLAREIRRSTAHDVELVKLPSPERTFVEVVRSYEQFWRLDLSHFDMVLSGKYPAWMVRHPHHVVYMLHPLRGLYDTYPPALPQEPVTRDGGILELLALLAAPPDDRNIDEVFALTAAAVARLGEDDPMFAFPGPLARRLVRYLDGAALQPQHISRYAAISQTVARRAGYFPPGADVRVVIPPSQLEGYRSEGFDHFLSAGRLDGPKRVHLLIESMRHYRGAARLIIAGTGPEEARLRAAASGDARISVLGRVTSDQLLDLYARARAVVYVPQDEDLGLVTMEAMASSKPVITTDDAGGPTELVQDEVSGLIVKPDAANIGAAMERLSADTELCRAMGAEGKQRVEAFTWARVLEVLLGESSVATRVLLPAQNGSHAPSQLGGWRRPRMRKLVVLSTFPVYPRAGGGQLRCFGLYGAMRPWFDIEIVSMDAAGSPGRELLYAPGFIERSIARSAAHVRYDEEQSRMAGTIVSDVVAPAAAEHSPAYAARLAQAVSDASAAMLAHPYLLPLLRQVAPSIPVVYDAHNAEYQLKAGMFPGTQHAQQLLRSTEQVERDAMSTAVLVSACSEEDAVALQSQYGIADDRLIIVPNGIDAAHTEFVSGTQRTRRRERWLRALQGDDPFARHDVAVFIASWHPPNLDAARRIIDFAPQLPGVLFLLLGSHCHGLIGTPLPQNVRSLGMVSDDTKRSLLSLASAGLNPMLSGTGTNLKLIEYFATGVPVVSTPTGVRGVAVEDFAHLRIVPIERFVDGVRHVIANQDEADEMARAARSLVEMRYDWRLLGEQMADAVQRALDTVTAATARIADGRAR